MTPYLAKVRLEDELSAFNCGVRHLIAFEGRKWVQLIEPTTARRRRCSVRKWRTLKPERAGDITFAQAQVLLSNCIARQAREPVQIEQRCLNSKGE